MREVIVTDGETQEVWGLYRKGEELPARVPTAQGGPTPVEEMGKIAEETIGRPLSRAEALKIAQQILERAEQERLFLTLG